MAQGNWWGGWGEEIVEDAIYHQVDDPTLGLVDFAFYLEIAPGPGVLPVAGSLESVTVHPNPFNPGKGRGRRRGSSSGRPDTAMPPGARRSATSLGNQRNVIASRSG